MAKKKRKYKTSENESFLLHLNVLQARTFKSVQKLNFYGLNLYRRNKYSKLRHMYYCVLKQVHNNIRKTGENMKVWESSVTYFGYATYNIVFKLALCNALLAVKL